MVALARLLGVAVRGLVVGLALTVLAVVRVLVALAVRLVPALGLALLALLAAVSLAVAVFEIQGDHGTISLAHLASLIHLDDLRDEVGRYLHRLEAPGGVAWVSVGAGAGAVALGLLLLAAVLVPRREWLVALTDTPHGPLRARRRALARAAVALAERTGGVAGTRVRASSRRRGGARLRVRARRNPGRDRRDIESQIARGLDPLTGPFAVTARVDARATDRPARVQ